MMVRFFSILFFCLPAFLVALGPATADDRSQTLNRNTIGIIAGESTWLSQVQAMAKVLDHEDGLRILPIAGAGSLQALQDLSFLEGVDAALLPADVLTYAEAQGLRSGISGKIAYVARFSTLQVTLVTRKDIANITALAGKQICTGPAQSAGFVTGEMLLGTLGIPFTRVALSGPDAIAALASGKADAALILGSSDMLQKLDHKHFHVLPVPVPAGLESVYAPALVSKEQLHGLSAPENAETVAVPLVIAAKEEARESAQTKSLSRFASALFAAAATQAMQQITHQTNLAADVPGWKRHAASTLALNGMKNAEAGSSGTSTLAGAQP